MARRWPSWINAALLLVMSFVVVAAMALHPRPGTDVVAMVFPPWWSVQRALLAAATADAEIVRTTALGSVIVVRPHDGDGLSRLRAAGGWFAIDPRAAAACFGLS